MTVVILQSHKISERVKPKSSSIQRNVLPVKQKLTRIKSARKGLSHTLLLIFDLHVFNYLFFHSNHLIMHQRRAVSLAGGPRIPP